MSTPVKEIPEPSYPEPERRGRAGSSSDGSSPTIDEDRYHHDGSRPHYNEGPSRHLQVDTTFQDFDKTSRSPSAAREQRMRLEDDLAVLEAERVASRSTQHTEKDARSNGDAHSLNRSRSRRAEDIDEFDEATNPLHEKAAVYNPPENPSTGISKFVKKLHESSFIVRYFTYIVPLVLILLIPLLVGALAFPDASVGGVELLWFSVWLEIVWLTLWAGRIVAKLLPGPINLVASIFTNSSKKWRDVAIQLELPVTLFLWWLGIEISFLPTMKNHHVDGDSGTHSWENTLNKIIISIFVWTVLNLVEKFLLQLIAMSFHRRTYSDRIEINKFQIGSLTKLYAFSRDKITETDEAFEEKQDNSGSGTKTPLQYVGKARGIALGALNKVGDVAGAVAADFTGRKVNSSSHPSTVVLALLRTTSGCQTLARRLYRTFVREGFDTVFPGDLKEAFDDNEEAEAAFSMFDKDMNGDISMEELEAVCVEIGRERKAITASLKDLDSVVSRLGNVFEFFVAVIAIIVFLTLISTSAAGVLTSAGSSILALSWLFSATAQEFLQSVVFVFVKHPFDVGDRVTIYGNSGDAGLGDDYYVKQISLLYTEFKKMQGHIVQAPNSYLNTLFVLNQRRSGALAEAVPIVIKYGTTLEQMDALRQRLLEFVRSERREFQMNILTELRSVTENFSVTLNVVFFYKSNWQNEGLRLQRRNKFICMLMVALQEIGIEGPRMNLQGASVDIPYHVAGYPPTYQAATAAPANDNGRPPATPLSEEQHHPGNSPATARRPSILRKGMVTANNRARGVSISRKHVDFSLGMRDISTEDIMGDVFEARSPATETAVRQVIAERRIQEEEAERQSQESARRRPSANTSRSNLAVPNNNSEPRRSTESGGGASLASVTRNRFFRTRSHSTQQHDLMEQGRSSEQGPSSSAQIRSVSPSSQHQNEKTQ
ncbi:Mechanosensitive ion channel family [Aspergillus stella-maris]|uniref:Mechanosensitive ion channel family n=1 Tax=Aspergillus stella-maris TaxID=1810926 RepID=UPI003CCCEFC9